MQYSEQQAGQVDNISDIVVGNEIINIQEGNVHNIAIEVDLTS